MAPKYVFAVAVIVCALRGLASAGDYEYASPSKLTLSESSSAGGSSSILGAVSASASSGFNSNSDSVLRPFSSNVIIANSQTARPFDSTARPFTSTARPFISTARPFISTARPASTYVEPYPYPPAKYEFSYGVNDETTGDIKMHTESRDGDFVRGVYSLVDPDGYKRTVTYTADNVNGFNAIVSRVPYVYAKSATASAANVASARPAVAQTKSVTLLSELASGSALNTQLQQSHDESASENILLQQQQPRDSYSLPQPPSPNSDGPYP